jgi:hypothetical protein
VFSDIFRGRQSHGGEGVSMPNRTRSRGRRLRLSVGFASLLAVSAALIAVPLAVPAGAASVAARVGSLPLVPNGAVEMGRLAPSTVLTVDVALKPRNPAFLASYATAVSTPASSLYLLDHLL